jgi:hypothetical protein
MPSSAVEIDFRCLKCSGLRPRNSTTSTKRTLLTPANGGYGRSASSQTRNRAQSKGDHARLK